MFDVQSGNGRIRYAWDNFRRSGFARFYRVGCLWACPRSVCLPVFLSASICFQRFTKSGLLLFVVAELSRFAISGAELGFNWVWFAEVSGSRQWAVQRSDHRLPCRVWGI
ncbi:uncharacterized protein BDR25DRAFT_26152 [Lindgomyces ingoldianus]|uniref:Uncharacterized protein n=1 Tax=Lindgomyces ingoldianus TaxID=673940 RepID=A0ACB6QWG4_9PLEO|nr:uncharacterized protein BDR25DRAFT_26152 [Lindgomyces ingoldianus]KAF2471363.1 hypothetical protein BDR25DRAFT_26152 [Lindgomyces ingoldianus]